METWIIIGLLIAILAVVLIRRSGGSKATDPELAAVRATLAEKERRIGELEDDRASQIQSLSDLREKLDHRNSEVASLEEKLRAQEELTNEKLNLLNDAKKALTDAFTALAGESLQKNSREFLEVAKGPSGIGNLIDPIKTQLGKLDEQIQALEGKREHAYGGLQEQIKGLLNISQNWQKETAALTHALKTPGVRGRWGEVQLKRLVELAGMLDHVDFREQQSKETDEGKQRPDMLVNLPNGRLIVVDSKVPFDSYFAAIESDDEVSKGEFLERHVSTVRSHFRKLSSKSYNSQFANSPDFTVLFMNLESAFSAALISDPSLIEEAVSEGIIIATPTTLLALLKAVAYGWQHERLAKNAEEIRKLGKDIHERIQTFVKHYNDLGGAISNVVTHYTNATGSLESRVLVSVRKFAELGVPAERAISELQDVDKVPRLMAKENLPTPHSKENLLDS